jgi:FkbM family methyltransferase
LAANLDAHVDQLSGALTSKAEDESIRRFVSDFLRPCGDRPVARVFADTLVERAERAQRDASSASAHASARRRQGAERDDGSDLRGEPDPSTLRQAQGRPEQGRRTTGSGSSEGADKPLKTLRIAYPGSTLRVWATPETRTMRRHGELFLNEGLLHWLDDYVRPGDVVYDIGASMGAYSLVAATHRGALTVAFEPAFATYKRLCDNVLLNNCRRSIVPLPLALGAQSGLFELEYPADSPGEGHTVTERPWRPGPDEREGSYVQPVCVEPLDEVIRRHRLARPHHVRVATARAAGAILRGAAKTIGTGALKSLLVAAPDASPDALVELASAAGLKSAATLPREDGVNVLFVRERARSARRLPWLGRR